MTSRKWLVLGISSTVVLVCAVALGVIGINISRQSVTAWTASHDLAPGAPIGPGDVTQIALPVGSDPFTVATSSPVGLRTTHAISNGDVLRPDDTSTGAKVQVAITLHLAPALSQGDVIDIYASDAASTPGGASSGTSAGASVPGTAPQLIARGVPVVSAGSPIVVSVPANEEPLWVALSTAQIDLIAVRSTGVSVPANGRGYKGKEARDILAQIAAGNSAAGVPPAPTSSPSPSGRP